MRKCPSGKRRYGHEKEARAALAKIVAERASDRHERDVYECRIRHCKGWHLTAQLPRHGERH